MEELRGKRRRGKRNRWFGYDDFPSFILLLERRKWRGGKPRRKGKKGKERERA